MLALLDPSAFEGFAVSTKISYAAQLWSSIILFTEEMEYGFEVHQTYR